MEAINAYLPLIDAYRPKFLERDLVQYCIAPNIPDQWRLTFWLRQGHLDATVQDAFIILEELEREELKKKKKESNNQSGNKSDKNNKNGKSQNQQGKGNGRRNGN